MIFSELVDALKELTHHLALYVAHDTSIVCIVAGLGIFPLHWPRLGSEVVIEVCYPPILMVNDWTHVIYYRSGMMRTENNLSRCYMIVKS